MRILKLAIISVLAFSLILIFLFVLFPSHVSVNRIQSFHTGKARAAAAIADLGQWHEWNHFVSDSFLTHITVSSPASGAGAWLRSDQLSVKIKRADSDTVISIWNPARGKEFQGTFNIVSSDSGNVFIQWNFQFHVSWYPWEKLGAMFYEKQLGPVMDRSLSEFKMQLEKNP